MDVTWKFMVIGLDEPEVFSGKSGRRKRGTNGEDVECSGGGLIARPGTCKIDNPP